MEGITSKENILDMSTSVSIATKITGKIEVSLRKCMNICCIIRRFIKEEGGINKEKKASKAFIILKISNIKVNVSLRMSSRKLMSL